MGFGGERYVNNSGRNELIFSKVTQDADNLYFYVQTAKDISEDRSTGSWMQLYLDTDNILDNNWNGYEYIINYRADSDNKTTVAAYKDGSFQEAGEISYRVYGNQMMLAVPKSMLGISSTELTLNFKWADSRETYETVEDFYSSGDTMPYGRFNYVFNAK